MTLLESIGIEIGKDVAKRLVANLFARPTSDWSAPTSFEQCISQHLVFVANITARVEFFGLAEAKDTDHDTVDLFASLPRKFAARSKSKPVSESRLIAGRRNYLLLGAPGAGKTTTLKRVARRLLTRPSEGGAEAQYPLFIRLRDLTAAVGVVDRIGTHFGLTLDAIWKRDPDESDATCHERRVTALSTVADETQALILLDGLDEVEPGSRADVEREISEVAERCSVARLIVTCRSGDYNAQLRQFDALELAPLEPKQIEKIARRWTKEYERFLSLISAQPFSDLTSRPLFLCQLLVVFEQTGSIPDQPSDVVERVVRLALEEWDERHKRQPRLSRYASFDAAKKRDFLANLAFWFTYESPRERFSTSLLQLAYHDIHERFSLPQGESRLVARELETHTGIFVEVERDFEFSHLSLQEFLAATHLVRQPISRAFKAYLTTKPGPLAIAVALSTTPEVWLAELLLPDNTFASLSVDTLRSFFARLLQERPAFVASIELGLVAISLASTPSYGDEYVSQFLKLPVVQRSVGKAGMCYRLSRDQENYWLALKHEAIVLLPNIPRPPAALVISLARMKELEAMEVLKRSDISG